MKTNPLTIKDIEKIALNTRKQFNIKENEAFPILEVLEDLFENKLLSVQYLEDNDAIFEIDTPAKYNSFENFIYIKKSVIEEYEAGVYRANFTLAHEFFHYIQTKVLEFDFFNDQSQGSYEDPEWQANEFAAQLLIPTRYINLPDEELIALFHVSQECVAVRKLYYKRRLKK